MEIFKILTIICFFYIQADYCLIDPNLIVTSIPKPTGQVYLEKTQIINGTVDFGYQEVQLIEKCQEQNEKQKSVLTVLNGGHVKNLIVGVNAGNGIVCKGNCTLENVHWRDVCEVI